MEDTLDRLNRTMDALFAGAEEDSPPAPELQALLRADECTPEPDPAFVAQLRHSLTQRNRPVHRAIDVALGIPSSPFARPAGRVRATASAFALVAALLLGLFAFKIGWSDHAPQVFGVPTARASTTAA